MGWIIALAAGVVIIGIYGALTYNRLVGQRNRVDNAWAQVEVQLQRRYDLIPNLVETVKGYASHERETFERVTEARSASVGAQGPAAQAQADSFLTSALRQLFAVAEAYPELRASSNFASLQGDLTDTENKIAVSRQIYNDTVYSYNTSIQRVPTNIVAALTGFSTRETYDASDLADTAPDVSF